ncbi:OsmC family protein [Desertivirga arenae]|uniref:OsmC family protein n=1 Tax=Desertivirga arenae TaxID=2810309 RepID=UPI001A97A463|nr:OsmC family protein [Pedobacter sp. SYSU D00823]
MATSKITYLGDLRTESVHLQSGDKIITDAPVDNKGRGEAFSPTDLLATSLGSCMITIMAIAARERGINIDGTSCNITKVMAAEPRRVSEIHAELHFPANYTDKEKAILEHAAKTCPVFYSLHPDIVKNITFVYS